MVFDGGRNLDGRPGPHERLRLNSLACTLIPGPSPEREKRARAPPILAIERYFAPNTRP